MDRRWWITPLLRSSSILFCFALSETSMHLFKSQIHQELVLILTHNWPKMCLLNVEILSDVTVTLVLIINVCSRKDLVFFSWWFFQNLSPCWLSVSSQYCTNMLQANMIVTVPCFFFFCFIKLVNAKFLVQYFPGNISFFHGKEDWQLHCILPWSVWACWEQNAIEKIHLYLAVQQIS